MIALLAQAAGSHGMAGGQAIDLASGGQTLTLAQLEDMHLRKTGALIRSFCSGVTREASRRQNWKPLRNTVARSASRSRSPTISGRGRQCGNARQNLVDRERETHYPLLMGLSEAKPAPRHCTHRPSKA
jgi:farnesyl diphosphate synthase